MELSIWVSVGSAFSVVSGVAVGLTRCIVCCVGFFCDSNLLKIISGIAANRIMRRLIRVNLYFCMKLLWSGSRSISLYQKIAEETLEVKRTYIPSAWMTILYMLVIKTGR